MEFNKDESPFEHYLKLGIERYSGNNWTIGDYINNDGDFYIKAEMYFEKIERSLLKMWEDQTFTNEANVFLGQADTILNMILNAVEKEAINQYTHLHDKLPFIKNTIENIKNRLRLILSKSEVGEGKLPALSNDNRDEYFKLHFSNAFPTIEQRLYDAGYIDINRMWTRTAPELVALLLVAGRYFTGTIKGRKQKDFFQTRYRKDITQQAKPSRQKDAEPYKHYFETMVNEAVKQVQK
ncbi:MAG TPA: hypothetical protein PLL71_10750 [Agriterribacter sp.]|nr:hypothetical protein [Agriterribacter sp.]HRP33929.1 hypothetical protein [Agriterribacter sp.]HRQ49331.1 hypothetical protein [Agriterribacter sp.]